MHGFSGRICPSGGVISYTDGEVRGSDHTSDDDSEDEEEGSSVFVNVGNLLKCRID